MARQSVHPPVRQMIREAVDALGGSTTNAEVRDWVLAHYPGTNEGTIRDQIIYCSVNHTSRIHQQVNRRNRQATDARFDILYRTARGHIERYDPQRHGVWYIVQTADGHYSVSQHPSKVVLPSS